MEETLSLSTHVLDLVLGKPGVGVNVKLSKLEGNVWFDSFEGGSGTTDQDGRFRNFKLKRDQLGNIGGTYKLTFDTKEYFERHGRAVFYPSVEIIFNVESGEQHYHVPLVLSTFGYSTYRGS